jgi:Ca2+-binding RTX toxin-like protein
MAVWAPIFSTSRQSARISAVSSDLTFTIHEDSAVSIVGGAANFNRVMNISDLVGGSGNNRFNFENGGSVRGTVDGGSGGSNTLDYSAYKSGVVVDLTAGTATGTAAISNFDHIVGGGGGDDLTGNSNHNRMEGGAGSDIYRLRGSWWDNTVIENLDEGDDTLDFSSVSTSLTVNIGTDSFSVIAGPSKSYSNFEGIIGGAGDDHYHFVENWAELKISELAGNGTDTLNFSSLTTDLNFTLYQNESLSVVSDSSVLSNLENFENLSGGSGDDLFRFDDGAVLSGTIDGYGGSNTLDYSGYTSSVDVDLTTGTATGTSGVSNVDHLLGGSGDDTLVGNPNANTLVGGQGDDQLIGGAGDDQLFGGEGDDLLEGGAGGDRMEGNAGRDKLVYANDPAGVTVRDGRPGQCRRRCRHPFCHGRLWQY